jgi:hypothetical protein
MQVQPAEYTRYRGRKAWRKKAWTGVGSLGAMLLLGGLDGLAASAQQAEVDVAYVEDVSGQVEAALPMMAATRASFCCARAG